LKVKKEEIEQEGNNVGQKEEGMVEGKRSWKGSKTEMWKMMKGRWKRMKKEKYGMKNR
jgi:hypothetical protein